MMSNSESRKRLAEAQRGDEAGVEGLRERDTRLYAWLANVKPGDIVTVRLNSTDTLTGKVYEAPDARGTSLCVWTTVLRYGNGYPGPSYEPVDVAARDAAVRAETAERIATAIAASFSYGGELRPDGSEDPSAAAYVEGLHDAWAIARGVALSRSEGRATVLSDSGVESDTAEGGERR